MIWGGLGVIDIVRSPLSLLPEGEGSGMQVAVVALPSPSGRRVGDEGVFGATFSQREKGASLRLRRPVHIIVKREREKLRTVAGRVDDRPYALAKDVLVFAGSADPFDRAGFRALVGHEDLVAVAVGLNACTGEGVTLVPRFRFFDATDREVVEKLRSIARLHDAGAMTDRIGRELRCAADWKRIGGQRWRGRRHGDCKNQECA